MLTVEGILLVKVMIDPECASKIAPTLLAQAAKKLETQVLYRRFRARQKWLEKVDVSGNRLGLSCDKDGDIIMVTSIRYLQRPKKFRGTSR